jgi:hypothetical protein
VSNELGGKPGQAASSSTTTSTSSTGGGMGGATATSTATGPGGGGAGGGGAGGGGGGIPKCATDADCAKSVDGPVCEKGTGQCVACLPAQDMCPPGQYCASSFDCIPGCRTDADCNLSPGGMLTCDAASHVCLGCAADADCPPGTLCDAPTMSCVPGCTAGHPCPAGDACCAGECANLQSDEGHCGGCDTPCAPPGAAGKCSGGACTVGSCEPGLGDCDGKAVNGCEVDVATDPKHCGTCPNACAAKANASPACEKGQCTLGPCDPGFGDCDGLAGDGCEVKTSVSVKDCGSCGNTCDLLNANAACSGGKCVIASCPGGFADCDKITGNGCEVSTQTDIANCGTCDKACMVPHAAPKCAGGTCKVGQCAPGYEDCNGLPGDGCEINTGADVAHCGGCNTPCAPNHATGACSGGVCAVATCDVGFGDCDGLPGNGCEVDLTQSVPHCGTCGTACSANHGTPSCSGGTCAIACAMGYGNCDMKADNGCEVNLLTDAQNCNVCMHVCPSGGGSPYCAGGACGVTMCPAGMGNCDGLPGNGCEASLIADPLNCGACGNVCFTPNGVPSCVNSACAVASCSMGHGNCDGLPGNGCEAPLDTLTDCGGCNTPCSPANATGSCVTGACAVASCTGAFAACDGLPGNGCEANTQTDALHCGGCAPCSASHGTPGCSLGACTIACDPGFGDCNADPSDGCETPLDTPQACASCLTSCAVQNGSPACTGGKCAVASCNPPYADCDLSYANGCEVNTATNMGNCGACNAACNSIHGAATCAAGACVLACAAGYGNCDGAGANGCEAVLATSNQNCGACGNACPAGRTCSAGVCTPGWLAVATASAPPPREMAAAAWIGSGVFVWGGSDGSADLGDGGVYHDATDTWTSVGAAGTPPSARVLASAVWTGSRAIVWGGGPFAGTNGLDTGARYQPATNDWIGMSALGAPSPRRMPIAVWSGKYMVVWGGLHNGAPVAGGGLYDEAQDAWLPMSGNGAPSLRSGAASCWTGKLLLLFGGRIGGAGATNEGYAYDPALDQWHPLSLVGSPPSARYDAFGVWMNGRFLVWEGKDATGTTLTNGAAYDPVLDTWFPVSASSAPSKRSAPARRSGWVGYSGAKALIAGGFDTSLKKDGGLYTPGTNTWATAGAWPSAKEHDWGAGVWTGQELVLWSGLHTGALTTAGDRYMP